MNVNPYLDPEVPQKEEKLNPYTNVAKALEENATSQGDEEAKVDGEG